MTVTSQFEPPTITDRDIYWAASLLGLPRNAFHGDDGNDPRQEVLKSVNMMDVAACPGSGKTTLLVAKLAILAQGWRHRTRGICVLSHTNAARHEIESRLGNSNVGRRLLSYPHFIGTIHGFVNEFLALPWLRSKGISVQIIDTEICLQRRWNALPKKIRSGLENKRNPRSLLRIKDPECLVGDIPWSKGKTLGTATPTYQAIENACRNSIVEGFFCYDEMFIWANELMNKKCDVVEVVRDRFPLLFIDEAQDNSEEQSAILHRIFLNGGSSVVRQRLGDKNQAIYGFVEAKGATTDKFPDDSIKTDLPNSHRFGQDIADLVDPLGLTPYGLKGLGPKKIGSAPTHTKGNHTVFLFDDDNAHMVLDAYAGLLIETFSDSELQEGTFTAVGQIHRGDRNDRRPHHIGHYWADYDPELSKSEPRPQTFVQYVSGGIGKYQTSGEVHHAVELVAQGILRLASMATDPKGHPLRRHSHRYVLNLLETNIAMQHCYVGLVAELVLYRNNLTKETWNKEFRPYVHCIAETIAGESLNDSRAIAFLEWSRGITVQVLPSTSQKSRDNIYHFSRNGKKVGIRIGSVHSVKGKNHTATLVLETYWKDRNARHNLELLLPWLHGENSGAGASGKEQKERLKIHYVAMTRPSHLLCLAMKRSAFEINQGTLNQDLIDRMEQHGWRVVCI